MWIGVVAPVFCDSWGWHTRPQEPLGNTVFKLEHRLYVHYLLLFSSREICKLNFCMNFCCLGCHQLSLELGFWQGMSLSRGMKENWSNCGCLHHSIRVSFILFVLCLSRVLRFALNSCLYFALCGSVGGETSQDLCPLAKLCGSGAAPLIFSCLSGLMGCQDPSHQLQRGLWVSSTPMENLVLAYCAVSKRL